MYNKSSDIESMVKQANILGRLYRGTKGGITGGLKGMGAGAALGLAAAPLAGIGLAGALGVGGAGMASLGMLGAGAGASVGALRGLLSKSPRAALAKMPNVPLPAAQRAAFRAGTALPAAALGGGLGYLVSDDNKMLGTALGAAGGIAARPMLMKALAKRAGGAV